MRPFCLALKKTPDPFGGLAGNGIQAVRLLKIDLKKVAKKATTSTTKTDMKSLEHVATVIIKQGGLNSKAQERKLAATVIKNGRSLNAACRKYVKNAVGKL